MKLGILVFGLILSIIYSVEKWGCLFDDITIQSIVTFLGFGATAFTFHRNNKLAVDKMMREESKEILSNDEILKYFYSLNLKGFNDRLQSCDMNKFMENFVSEGSSFDKLLLTMNRIAFLHYEEPDFKGEYFQFYFDSFAKNEFVLWFLSHGTFQNPENPDSKSFDKLFESLKKFLNENANPKVDWKMQKQKQKTNTLYKEMTKAYHAAKSSKLVTIEDIFK